jgi:hypothetical protein
VLDLDNAAELTGEGTNMAQKNQRVKVLRAFYHRGETLGKGSVATLPYAIAVELRSANRVEFVQADVKEVTHPEPTKPVVASQPAVAAVKASAAASGSESGVAAKAGSSK